MIAKGKAHYQQKEFKEALECFQYGSDHGDLDSTAWLALCYLRGEGTDVDSNRAAQLFSHASSKGHVEASYYLGCLHQKGLGVPHNPASAISCFQYAASRGHGAAGIELAKMQATYSTEYSAPKGMMDSITETISQFTHTEKLQGFSLKELFSEVLRPRSSDEIEDYFSVGYPSTTPPISKIPVAWPKPWLFVRMFFFLGLMSAVFYLTLNSTDNPILIPGMIILAAFFPPVSLMILFYELNILRNISLYQILRLFLMGAGASLVFTMIGFSNFTSLEFMGASSAGIIEEISKIITVVICFRNPKHGYILNGLLAGAVVGAGFAAFESAGYIYIHNLKGTTLEDMIFSRAIFAPFCHVVWTAISSAALWRVMNFSGFDISHLANPRFYKVMLLSMGLHAFWNSKYNFILPFPISQLIVGAIGWYMVFVFVQTGIRQVKEFQEQ